MKLPLDLSAYGPAVAEILTDSKVPPLGPGKPTLAMRAKLAELTPEKLAGGRKIVDRAAAQGCIAGLWLWHNFLDESHTISQEIETAEGSFWHGIMHRREPDYGNAKYWFRRVGSHPVYGKIASAAADIWNSTPADAHQIKVVQGATWDPFAFVDLCERAAKQKPEWTEACQSLAVIEWGALFEYCWQKSSAHTGV